MNNLERILDRINADADLEIKKSEEAADMRVESIQKDTAERLDLIKLRAENAAMKEYQSIISRAEAKGAMAEKDIILKAKAELIDKVYRDAESFIEDTSSYENLNPVAPPDTVCIKSNSHGYVYTVPNSPLFESTRFISGESERVGTKESFGDIIFK